MRCGYEFFRMFFIFKESMFNYLCSWFVDFHFFNDFFLEMVVCIYVCLVSLESVEFIVLPTNI